MDEVKNNSVVRWKPLVAILIMLISSSLGFTYLATSKNISKETFQQFEKRFETHSRIMMNSLNKIEANQRNDEMRNR